MTSANSASPTSSNSNVSTSRGPLVALLGLVAAVVIFSFVAPAVSPGPEGLASGAIGLATTMVLGFAGALVAAIVIVAALVAARSGKSWAVPTAWAALALWIVAAGVLIFLMVGF